ncbi:hypothetical protein [Sandaracinus amylolyticus]|uniref:hypothetical protein n=1 Tax=Sandaracinus amylolyticus TaxID=927083 RepID=UPI001F16281F|nr:hypothetical protein [Sandaracinus amylolyticus]
MLTSRTPSELVGSYARAGSLVTFESRTTGSGRAELHLVVNGFTYDVAVDRAAGTVHLDGHGGTVFVEDREAMAALEQTLGDAFTFDESTPLHEVALLRAASQLGDAPLGLTFDPRVVDVSEARGGDKLPSPGTLVQETLPGGVETVVGIMGADGEILAVDDPSAPEALHCQYGNEDGIWRLPGCNGVHWAWAEHDATNHCLRAENSPYGTGTDGCSGRCGITCNSSWNLFTWDCLEHDDCSIDHGGGTNPWDASCGDEYWEAADDWWSWGDAC